MRLSTSRASHLGDVLLGGLERHSALRARRRQHGQRDALEREAPGGGGQRLARLRRAVVRHHTVHVTHHHVALAGMQKRDLPPKRQ